MLGYRNYDIPYFLAGTHICKCFSYFFKRVCSVNERTKSPFFNQFFNKAQGTLNVFGWNE